MEKTIETTQSDFVPVSGILGFQNVLEELEFMSADLYIRKWKSA